MSWLETMESIPTDFGDYFVEKVNDDTFLKLFLFLTKSYVDDSEMKSWFPELKNAIDKIEPIGKLCTIYKLVFCNKSTFNFAIFSKSDSENIIGYIQISGEPKIAISTCYICKALRKNHIMTTILKPIVNHFIDNFKFVTAKIDSKNVASIKLFEKLGFKCNESKLLYELFF